MTFQFLSFVKLSYAQMTPKSGIQSDGQSLQSNLDLLSKWSEEWLQKLCVDKCRVMHIDRNSKAKYYLELDNKCLEVAESEVERDLGI